MCTASPIYHLMDVDAPVTVWKHTDGAIKFLDVSPCPCAVEAL